MRSILAYAVALTCFTFIPAAIGTHIPPEIPPHVPPVSINCAFEELKPICDVLDACIEANPQGIIEKGAPAKVYECCPWCPRPLIHLP